MSGVDILGFQVPLFWIGVAGAVAVEVATFSQHYDSKSHPEKYRKPGFYLSRLFLAFIGGLLVSVYGITTAPAALQIGASASALVVALGKRESPPS